MHHRIIIWVILRRKDTCVRLICGQLSPGLLRGVLHLCAIWLKDLWVKGRCFVRPALKFGLCGLVIGVSKITWFALGRATGQLGFYLLFYFFTFVIDFHALVELRR